MSGTTYGFLTATGRYYDCTSREQRDHVCKLHGALTPVEIRRNVVRKPDWSAQGEERWWDEMVDASGNRIRLL